MQDGHWFMENLALILGLLISGFSGISLITAFKSGRMTREVIGAVAAFILGVGIVFSQIGLL